MNDMIFPKNSNNRKSHQYSIKLWYKYNIVAKEEYYYIRQTEMFPNLAFIQQLVRVEWMETQFWDNLYYLFCWRFFLFLDDSPNPQKETLEIDEWLQADML